VYRAALGISVPVPEGWSVDDDQGPAMTTESPPQGVIHGPRFTIEKLAGITPAVAFQGRCGGRPGSHAEGPTAVAGHAGSYQYLCQPRTFIGPEWTVLVPDSSTPDTWRITYLGAGGIGGRDQLSMDFTAVLAAFTSTAPAPPLGDASGIAVCTSSGAAFAQATGSAVRVAAGYMSTAAAVSQWQERGRFGSSAHTDRSSFRDHPAAEPVAVCFLDGNFATYGKYPPPPPTGPRPSYAPYDRIVVLVPQNHSPVVDTAGRQNGLPATDRP
jgi:hypothetical protein